MQTIPREIAPVLTQRFRQYPFVFVTGPRQSGKTTLCRQVFSDLDYANLESPQEREFAVDDPVGFLNQFKSGAVHDEVQRVPELRPTYRCSVMKNERTAFLYSREVSNLLSQIR